MDVTPSTNTVDSHLPPVPQTDLSYDTVIVQPISGDTPDAIDLVHPPILVDPDI